MRLWNEQPAGKTGPTWEVRVDPFPVRTFSRRRDAVLYWLRCQARGLWPRGGRREQQQAIGPAAWIALAFVAGVLVGTALMSWVDYRDRDLLRAEQARVLAIAERSRALVSGAERELRGVKNSRGSREGGAMTEVEAP